MNDYDPTDDEMLAAHENLARAAHAAADGHLDEAQTAALVVARISERNARKLLLSAALGAHWVEGHRRVAWWSGLTVVAALAAIVVPVALAIALIWLAFAITLVVKLYSDEKGIRELYGNIPARRSLPGWPTRRAIRGAQRQYERARELHGRALDTLSALEDR